VLQQGEQAHRTHKREGPQSKARSCRRAQEAPRRACARALVSAAVPAARCAHSSPRRGRHATHLRCKRTRGHEDAPWTAQRRARADLGHSHWRGADGARCCCGCGCHARWWGGLRSGGGVRELVRGAVRVVTWHTVLPGDHQPPPGEQQARLRALVGRPAARGCAAWRTAPLPRRRRSPPAHPARQRCVGARVRAQGHKGKRVRRAVYVRRSGRLGGGAHARASSSVIEPPRVFGCGRRLRCRQSRGWAARVPRAKNALVPSPAHSPRLVAAADADARVSGPQAPDAGARCPGRAGAGMVKS
jgi:hypothetical protein